FQNAAGAIRRRMRQALGMSADYDDRQLLSCFFEEAKNFPTIFITETQIEQNHTDWLLSTSQNRLGRCSSGYYIEAFTLQKPDQSVANRQIIFDQKQRSLFSHLRQPLTSIMPILIKLLNH